MRFCGFSFWVGCSPVKKPSNTSMVTIKAALGPVPDDAAQLSSVNDHLRSSALVHEVDTQTEYMIIVFAPGIALKQAQSVIETVCV